MAPQIGGNAADGTYNSKLGAFLLPPLVGLPYPDMVANGLGAQHAAAGDVRYAKLIVVHGVFAALACLGFIPSALICARFFYHGRNPRMAMYGHIGLNIASVLCLTVAFVVGFVAVGRENWGSNPHHIIGATVYAGVIFQSLFGTFVRWRTSRQVRKRISLDTMLHNWLGRGILFLGVAQVPLGLYVYGSPMVLFILYAVFVAVLFLAWFILEYLSTRGYFTHGFVNSASSRDLPTHEMSEREHSALGPRPGEVANNRYDDPEPVLQTPRRARFSLFSNVFKKREPGMNRESEQLVMDDRGTSFETSRAPSAHSPAMAGLYAPPGRQNNIPPVPSIPTHIPGPEGAMLHIDNQDRYVQRNNPMRENAYRDSTTLGHSIQHQPISMPEPPILESPYVSDRTNSGGIDPSTTVSDVSALSSGNHRTYPYQPVSTQYEEMPPSPMMDGRYMEADNGFIHGPLHGPQGSTIEPPMVPLPMPPEPRRQSHSRGRSNEDMVRLPISHSNEFLTIDRREATPGFESIRPSKKNPNVSVQVRVNPDGKSVTVRRIPTEEAERDRKERARQRAERATQREMSMDRDRQMRRSDSAHRRSSSIDNTDFESHTFSPISPDSNVSSAIAGHSGGLLGGASVIPPQPSRSLQQPYLPPMGPSRETLQTPVSSAGHPVPGMTYTGLGGGISPSQRGSVVSASAGSEIEQELAKDYRRRKRRDERSGVGSSAGARTSLMSSTINDDDHWN